MNYVTAANFRRQVGIGWLTTGLNLSLQYLKLPFIIESLGIEADAFISMTWLMTLLIIFDFGHTVTATRYLGRNFGKTKNPQLLISYFQIQGICLAILGLLLFMSALTIYSQYPINSVITGNFTATLILSCFYFLGRGASTFSAVLSGAGHTGTNQFCEVFAHLVSFVILVVFVYFEQNLLMLCVAEGSRYLISAFLKYLSIKHFRILHSELNLSQVTGLKYRYLKLLVPRTLRSGVGNAFIIAFFSSDVLLVDFFFGGKNASVLFALQSIFSIFIAQLLIVINTLYPLALQNAKNRDFKAPIDIRWILYVYAVLGGVLLLCMKGIFSVWLGIDFTYHQVAIFMYLYCFWELVNTDHINKLMVKEDLRFIGIFALMLVSRLLIFLYISYDGPHIEDIPSSKLFAIILTYILVDVYYRLFSKATSVWASKDYLLPFLLTLIVAFSIWNYHNA